MKSVHTIVLISCVSQKLPHQARAAEVYTSPLFVGALRYARALHPDAIYILSAKYGLLDLETEIEPYDMTLLNMRVDQVRAWAERVLEQLRLCTDLQRDHYVFLAGEKYRKYLVPHMRSYEVPMQGMRIGEQLQFLARNGHE
ncbi:MAG: hypothetical protein R6X16_08330 [Anaerolineae bacterium]